MADRYWVGGTDTWNSTAGTKWATTSGGAGGASAPTSSDDVYFDAASGAGTVSFSTSVCRSLDTTGFTGTLSGTGSINIYGNLLLTAGITYTATGSVGFSALTGSWTITTAGKTLGSVTFANSTAATTTWTLQDALISSGTITLVAGTFTTNNFNVTASSLSSSNNNTRAINLGSSTVTLSASSTAPTVQMTGITGMTFDAGTSQLNLTNSAAGLNCGGLTFYNVSFTSTATGTRAISVGSNTFNNLSVTGPATAGVATLTIDSQQTINGTLSTTGSAGNRRVWFRGINYGISQNLTINSAPSLTDADFRDLYVVGTAAPISGTRIGDLRGCRGITFDAPKNCYRIGTGNWSADQWSDTSGGTPNTDYFPLAQDTAVFDQNTTAGTHTMNSAIPYVGTVDMSARTSALTISVGATQTVYGNWTNGSGTAITGVGNTTFSGRNTQTITSAGKTFSQSLFVDSYGGTVELADALALIGSITVNNGILDTKGYAFSGGNFFSQSSGVRAIYLGSSTITLVGSMGLGATNLTFDAGTSTINNGYIGNFAGAGQSFYNVSINATGANSFTVVGANTFNNLTLSAPVSPGLNRIAFDANQTITGTLTVAGATAVRRVFAYSDIIGTPRTLTANSISADNCDFRDITIAGAAAGASPTRAGDCGGNSGITFPASKTVYWNLSGTQNWSATAWAATSGGTPAVNNFPLAQDTAVFDNAGAVGTVTIPAIFNAGTVDMSARTSAMTITPQSTFFVHGDWIFGAGVTSGANASSTAVTFAGRGTSTITSNGIEFNHPITIDCASGAVQLADALKLSSTRTLTLTSGTFDAVSYNVTAGLVSSSNSNIRTLKMGSGTWEISGIGSIWNVTSSTGFYKGTANILLSDTSTSARTFAGGGLSYNKLTIGGATGTSTLTISGNNTFTELASTKTVAHTIALDATTQTFGKWSVTGTAGNVVTITGSSGHLIAGSAVTGVDYLSMNTFGFSAASPGEFYAGANSTGTAAAPVYRTAKPADSTRYWVGGTGNWSDTARWSTSSGGAGGATVPRSHDDVVFDSASNATAYTATVNAITGGIRTKSLTIAGPASGNLTLAGSTAIEGIHGDVTLPATGLTRTYTGALTLSGSATGRTITTNGVTLASVISVNGVGCGWTLADAFNIGTNNLTVINGLFNTDTYNLTCSRLISIGTSSRTIDLGSSTISLTVNTLGLGTTENERANLVFLSGTSQINIADNNSTISGNNQTFYNVAFTSTAAGTQTINGANTFNNLSFTGITAAGLKSVVVTADQTVNGTFTLSAGTDATMRTFVRSDTIGTTRTLTCAAVSATDADFRDITITGAAAPVSGTRLGDCKGNSGITFDAPKTVYWRNPSNANWGATTWSATDGGTADVTQFPLAQDTAVFPSGFPDSGVTVTLNAAYNIGTIDMSARTTNTMTLATSSNQPTIYGNWINGTGTTLTGTGTLTFAGRGSQTITSAGRTFTQGFRIESPNGSVTLQDSFISSLNSNGALTVSSGTFSDGEYNLTLTAGGVQVGNDTFNRLLSINSTWFLGHSNPLNATNTTLLTVTGTGTISLTSASAKTFTGGNLDYSGITLDQAGAGTLTITGNNTFADITNSYKATGATTIAMGTTTQRVANFTASGQAGRVLTVGGTSAANPATLVFTGTGQATQPTTDYLTITGVRAYNPIDTWYAGANSTNNGSLGWYFENGAASSSLIYYGTLNITEVYYGSISVTSIYYGSIQVF